MTKKVITDKVKSAKKAAANQPTDIQDRSDVIEPSKQLRQSPKSFLPALLIVGAIVAIAAMTQSTRNLDRPPVAQSSPSTNTQVESVLASTGTQKSQTEAPTQAIVAAESANTAPRATPVKLATPQKHTTSPQAVQVQPPTASQAPDTPTPPPVTTTSPPTPPSSNPPVSSPPVETTSPKPATGLLQVVNNLLLTLF